MNRTVELIGAPMDLGADRRGVDMGPSAIRYGGLAETLDRLGHECIDRGDLEVPRPEGFEPDAGEHGSRAKYIEETRTVCKRLAESVEAIRGRGNFPLVLGGDHSIGIGTGTGLGEQETGVLWFDAHADLNTPETTPSGNVHGMTLAALLGKGSFAEKDWARAACIDESNIAIVGLRKPDDAERELIRESEINAFTMTDIDEYGITKVVSDALDAITAETEQLYVSLDLDMLDPSEAPGVGTPVRGGVSYREAHAGMELLYERAGADIAALELVEVNPILDESNRTAELACELAASALGSRIL